MATKKITREEFISKCPDGLKKVIEDFIVFYSEKKKANSFVVPTTGPSKKFNKDKFVEKKNMNLSSFRKPFEKSFSDYEKFTIDLKGTLSKINETNQDIIWKELSELQLEKYIFMGTNNTNTDKSSPNTDIGWVSVQLKKTQVTVKDVGESKVIEISNIFYQYTRTCSMYLRQYLDLIVRLKKNKELSVFYDEYLKLLIRDLEYPKVDNKEFNILTHNIYSELAVLGQIAKKNFIDTCLLGIYHRVIKNMDECESNDETMDILLQNMKKLGKLVYKQKDVVKILEDMKVWATNKVFSGKLHFLLIDLLNQVDKWDVTK